eukprot:4173550-Amphidinium_carterae.1
MRKATRCARISMLIFSSIYVSIYEMRCATSTPEKTSRCNFERSRIQVKFPFPRSYHFPSSIRSLNAFWIALARLVAVSGTYDSGIGY